MRIPSISQRAWLLCLNPIQDYALQQGVNYIHANREAVILTPHANIDSSEVHCSNEQQEHLQNHTSQNNVPVAILWHRL
jgi:hypothetical protein